MKKDDQTETYYRRKPTQSRSIQRVDQVLDATRQGILEGGYENLTMNEIAHRAGMKRSAIYRYFSGKSAIMVSLIELHHEDIHRLVQQLFSSVESQSDLMAAVQTLVSKYFQLFLDDPVLPAVWMGARSSPELSELCNQENEKIGRFIGHSLKRARPSISINPTIVAILLLELIGASARLALQGQGAASRDEIEIATQVSAVALAFAEN
ncbi:TetR/AcrR family transcriptional regulator [Ruegeria sp. EL01]|jgi:AcrR family transcriptional regulator|uniref:TetR/AcrR family transcriptional regulator n=1 Tax=Ruegeria sp. EL01 TaxID=2107578 RepID=UPI000EA808DC|nr:TetR/AcrR family transcriptional regulator [Ruegeria sp. EL01]